MRAGTTKARDAVHAADYDAPPVPPIQVVYVDREAARQLAPATVVHVLTPGELLPL